MSDGKVKVVVPEGIESAGLEALVNEDILSFERWFQKQGNDPLVRSEVAILKTYLWYKTHPEASNASTNQAPTVGHTGENDGQASGS